MKSDLLVSNMPATSRAAIDRFLSSKRLAFIGVSRSPSAFSRHLFREFVEHGYEVIPVNPKLPELDERPCYSRVGNIDPGVDTAFVMTAPAASEQVVRDRKSTRLNSSH